MRPGTRIEWHGNMPEYREKHHIVIVDPRGLRVVIPWLFRYAECGSYVQHYGNRVLAIEYRQVDFAATCARWGSRLAVVLRDRNLTSTGLRRFC